MMHPDRVAVPAVVPVAAAVGVFGMVYGAAATPIMGTWLTLTSSVLVFSGAAQFSMVGLLAVGAQPAAVLWAVAGLNLRHLALGALIRPLVAGRGRAKRAALAWFVVDETVGLTLVDGDDEADRTLLRSGVACYTAWIAGTTVGVAGAELPALEPLARAVFPVLFIGLAALTVHGRATAVRAVVAASLTAALLAALPTLGALAPLIAALAVTLPGDGR
jgi:predicted branched-subunit amino acid permease